MNRQSGFTLIELMTVVAIAMILLAVGVPSFQSLILNNRVASQANEFISALGLARSESAKRSRNVVLCPSTDQATCVTGTAPLSWVGGWIVFIDNNANGVLDTAETVLRVWQALPGSPTFNGPATVGYRPTGELNSSTLPTFSYTLSPRQFAVCFNAVGRSRIEKDTTSCP